MKDYSHRIGERFETNEGYKVVIVEYKNATNLLIEFQDEYKTIIPSTYQHCKTGEIKNPYHSSVLGMGMVGLMSDGSKPKTTDNGKHTREYELWKAMLTRCYSDKFHKQCPTYKDCTVCDRWLIFANFLEDLELIDGYELWRDNPKEYIALDKDLKAKGNKVYSLETCCFMTNSDNVKERNFRCGNPNSRKKVIAISLTEKKVIVFQSMLQAEKLGFSHQCISKCCQDKYKSYKGYKWKCI